MILGNMPAHSPFSHFITIRIHAPDGRRQTSGRGIVVSEVARQAQELFKNMHSGRDII